jgi:regulatory protein
MTAGGGPTLLQRAIALLARREHSRAELARKLARPGSAWRSDGPGEMLSPDELSDEAPARGAGEACADAAAIEAVLDKLEAKGMLSDRRFAAAVVAKRAARFGAQKIRQELKQSGVDDGLLQTSVAEIRATEFERARAVWRKKFGGSIAATPAERARQMRFLASRGFAAEVVHRVVRLAEGGGAED